jgi:hypothetical protein
MEEEYREMSQDMYREKEAFEWVEVTFGDIDTPPEADIDKKWAAVAKKRLDQLRSGEVQPIPGEEVFQRIWNRFSK